MDSLNQVEIDTGMFKYILIKVAVGNSVKYLVRGYKDCDYHLLICGRVKENELKTLEKKDKRLNCKCVGGGWILHNADEKYIEVWQILCKFNSK